jgi:Mitochondrial carrier protein
MKSSRIRKRIRCLLLSTALLSTTDITSALSIFKSSQAEVAFKRQTKNISISSNQNVDDDTADSSKRAFVASILATAFATTGTIAIPSAVLAKDLPVTLDVVPPNVTPSIDFNTILSKASKKAIGGGKAGAAAAVVQVCSLMWLRTAMNYQYVYGGTLVTSLQTLWDQGGIPRLYQGLPFAIVQGPLTRFGDAAANVGILALLETQDLPLPLKTACGSAVAGLWRIILMPIDTSKTAMQVQGSEGLQRLIENVKEQGPSPLYQGALASASATAAGHFPWFLTYNFLNEQLPMVTATEDLLGSLLRSAFLGLAASCVSDSCSNSLRVIKTTKQTAGLSNTSEGEKRELTYPEIVKTIIDTDGVAGLLGRGLQTRLLTNAIQGAAFSVLWKYFQQVGGV